MSRLRLLIAMLLFHSLLLAQEQGNQTRKGFNITGIPVLKFNSDEGFGYGARASIFHHADGGYNPYFFLIDTQVSFTTESQKEVFVFFDSPFLLGDGNRLTGEVRYQDNDFTPYYGLGHRSTFIEAIADTEDPSFINEDFYRFGRKRITAWLDYQRSMGTVRALAGFGINHTDVDLLAGTTLLEQDDAVSGRAGGFTNYIKLGLVYDTRDFEPAPNRGSWIDAVFAWSHEAIASGYNYRRLTLNQRQYISLSKKLVLAQRLAFINSWGDIPFYETAFIASTFRIEEGIGGSKSVRGVLKNRFLGPVETFGNLELRWRLTDFSLIGQNFFLSLNAFYDVGGAWNTIEAISLNSIQAGQGGGINIGWDESFIISIDAGRGEDTDFALYIGVGYLF
ncbi:MAG: Omp85 family outer membrane protein [Calditrichia bacterium]